MERMKRQTLKMFAMSSLLLMVTAVSVAAQSSRTKTTIIPFTFTVGEKTLPAGEYTIEPYRKDYSNVWVVKSRDGHSNVLFTTNSVQTVKTQKRDKIVFRQYGGQYFLSQIWSAGANSGRELVVRRPKSDLATNFVEQETVVVAIGSPEQR
jgi:hypothetical protein